jgi:hypothetical protein
MVCCTAETSTGQGSISEEADMLGELLGESTGKITGTRILSTAGPDTRVEVSFQGGGTLLGMAMTEMGTYWQMVRPGGILYGEGQVLMMTPEGETAPWTGFGVGRPTGPPPAATFGVCGAFNGASQKFARLNSVATAIEYAVDTEGGYRWRMWAWTGAAG